MSRNRWLAALAACALTTTALVQSTTSVAAPPPVEAAAPGGPGAMSHFDLARKDCVGTARNTTSKVWFTVAGGVLSDVYYPTIDNTNIETLQYVVTDGATFTDLQTRDTTYTVEPLDDSGMSCRVTSTATNGKYTLVTDYATDPDHNSVAMQTVLKPAPGVRNLAVYVRMDATVNGNGGGGNAATENAGADDAVIDTSTGSPVPVSIDTNTSTIAANRDYATPVFVALRSDRPFLSASSGFAGTASDGLVQLDTDHELSVAYTNATDGNVVQIAQVDARAHRPFTMAVGFGADQAEAIAAAGSTANANFKQVASQYTHGWDDYLDGLVGPGDPAGLDRDERAEIRRTYNTSAAVLKASEDKTFPGAVVASLASPWGQAVAAGDPALTYFGSYREVFARDLYETFTGLMAAGDTATAEDTVRFLFEHQQLGDGSFPRNSLINGKLAPDSFGVQLDEVAYPILMARMVGITDADFYTGEIRPAADFLVAHGPSFGSERWEEQSGFSPSTIAAEIAGLAAAGKIAEINGDAVRARIYRATADHYQRSIKDWTVTTNGPLSPEPYFIRLSKNAQPDTEFFYNLGNGGPDADQRAIVDAGFLELPRLGILPVDDDDVANSVDVVDAVIARSTNSGDGFYRYGTVSQGTEDGYGDCNLADATDCTIQGKPWAGVCGNQAQNRGSGHLWPVLSAERGEHHVALGDSSAAADLLLGMSRAGSGVGLIPEQVWENADLPASPFGTAPECASIGFVNGEAAGSASPLTWSAASFVRLDRTIRDGAITEQPEDTVARYIDNDQGATTLELTSPANGTLVTGTATVSGTTAPNATVDVDAVNIDIDGAAIASTTVAGADGSFTFDVPVPPGVSTLTVTATAPNGDTAFAQRTVVFDVVPGVLLFSAADPDGDDNGPGTYDYPNSSAFVDGAFDIQAFEVYDSGPDTVTFRVRTRDLTPTFGSALGAQLIDVYLRDPAATPTSTAPSFPQRNYTIDPAAAWSRLIEVQGFGQRFINASGATVGTVSIRGTQVTRWITFTVTKAALGGTPSSGWSFAVVLTGQDGFSPDQARGFQAVSQDFQFGVCTPEAIAAANPICAVNPATVPKAMDILTPDGTSQADVLNPLSPPVVIPAVTIP
jgi:glucoamylase